MYQKTRKGNKTLMQETNWQDCEEKENQQGINRQSN